MRIVKPLYSGRVGVTSKVIKGKTHIVKDASYTECGVHYRVSGILGLSEDGELKDVTCTRCVKSKKEKK